MPITAADSIDFPAHAPSSPRRSGWKPSLTILLLALGAAPAAAQAPPPVAPGDTVRVTVGNRRTVYQVVRAVPGILIVAADGRELELEIGSGSILRVETRATRTRAQQIRRGVGTGALVGGLAGAISGFAGGTPAPDCYSFCITRGEGAFLGAIVFGLAGGAIGAGVGAAVPLGNTWRQVPLRSLALQAGPAAGGIHLAVRWRR